MASTIGAGPKRRWVGAIGATLCLTVITGCQTMGTRGGTGRSAVVPQPRVSEVAGWTRDVLTESYFLVVNVLPAEPMYDEAGVAAHQPTEGELVLDGEAGALGKDVRHIEVHVYDRQNGDVLVDPVPSLHVYNRTTGERIDVAPTLMQDINVGSQDRHFGNNAYVRGNSDLSVTVRVGTEEASVDGHLD